MISRKTSFSLLLIAGVLLVGCTQSSSTGSSPSPGSPATPAKQPVQTPSSIANNNTLPRPSSAPGVTPAPSIAPVIPVVSVPPGATMDFNAVVFINMENKRHASDANNWAILENNGKTVAYGLMTASSATNASPLQSGGAYSAANLKIDMKYMDPSLPPQGTGQLSICEIQGPMSPSVTSANCVKSSTQGDSTRPTSWYRVNAPYSVSGSNLSINNRAYGNGDDVTGGLSLNHVMFSPAQGAQVATNDDASSPLVLDLDRDDKLSLTPVPKKGSAFPRFDLLALGYQTLTGWVKPNDGLLALDVNNDGKINDGTELFGEASYSVKPVGKFELSPFMDGFQALAQYDLNHDGVIDEKDAIFSKLLIWRDKNMNGISEKGELRTLKEEKIKAIYLAKTKLGTVGNWPKVNGNQIRLEGGFVWEDGTKGKIFDVWFAQDHQALSRK